jgi:S-formylglutathione hydrolase FrmB
VIQFAQASFPELAGLPPEHIEAGLQQLAQKNPQRFQQAMGILGRVKSLQAAAQQDQLVKAQEQRQQFEATVGAKVSEMIEPPRFWGHVETT